jgi:hypothetical protein
MTQAQAPIRIVRYRRSFVVDYQPRSLATGCVLREHHGDGWPTMAGPYQSAADAVGYIDELIAAGPLADYEDEYGNHVNVGFAPSTHSRTPRRRI